MKILKQNLPIDPKQFLDLDIKNITNDYLTKDPKIIDREGLNAALQLFYQVAEGVPAYKDFLKKHKIDYTKVKTIEDFRQIPIINKKNYLREYPLKSLCWGGQFKDLHILSSSSGSTGEPFLWPRSEEQELEGGLNFELIFNNFFSVEKYPTLYINCFAMGTWIAGPFVLACAENLSRKGYPIMSVTPGLERDVILSLFKNLAPHFDQIVISGYPPFIKDILDQGKSIGIDWRKHRVRFLFAAEGFSEKWRDYIHRKVGSKDDFKTSFNIYGSADAAILGHETPVTTTIRRLVSNNPRLLKKLFGDSRLPTLVQYDPRLKFFEEIEDDLIFTTRAGIPLVRYSIGDTGKALSYQHMTEKLVSLGFDLPRLIQNADLTPYFWKLPFIYLFGRSDLTVSLYGLLIYPEHIKYGLERSGLDQFITGKFVMSIEHDKKENPFLLIRVELQEGVESSKLVSFKIQSSVVSGLKKVNSEYSRLQESIKNRSIPVIELIENGNLKYFRLGAKQKWVKQ